MQGNGSIDLSEFDSKKGAEEGFKLNLRHPKTNQPTSAWIHVLGADSDAYQERIREFQRQRSEILKRNMRATFDPSDRAAQELDLLVAMTVGWEHIERKGQPIAFSQEEARKLYAQYPTIREQVDAAIHDRANFLPGNGTSS